MTVYQIAEASGTLTADEVRNTLSPSDLCEWGVYLNSPFSRQSREMMMNGWLVQVIRSIMADKKRLPKFSDSVFPFGKLAQEFFDQPKKSVPKRTETVAEFGNPETLGEVAHLTQVLSKRYEEALADYRAGRTTNRFGLYVNESFGK